MTHKTAGGTQRRHSCLEVVKRLKKLIKHSPIFMSLFRPKLLKLLNFAVLCPNVRIFFNQNFTPSHNKKYLPHHSSSGHTKNWFFVYLFQYLVNPKWVSAILSSPQKRPTRHKIDCILTTVYTYLFILSYLGTIW